MTEQENSPATEHSSAHNPHLLRKLYDWVLHFSGHPHAATALFLIAFAEASFFPIPPDVLLLAMAIAAPHKAMKFALVCTAGSVLGGIAGYLMGWGLWDMLDSYFYEYIPGFSQAGFNTMANHFADNTFWTIFTAGFTPIPFKIFTIAAGAAMVPFLMFLLGSVISRGLRFAILGALIMIFGASIKNWIDRYFNILSLLATLIIVGLIIVYQYH
jgi:membrane protein YqaA with SNARE-associated domain